MVRKDFKDCLKQGGSSQTSAVRQLFEKSGADNAYQSRFSKLAASRGNASPSPTKKPEEKVNGQAKPVGAPSWIAIAQVMSTLFFVITLFILSSHLQRRSSMFEDKESKAKVAPAAPKPATATTAPAPAPATTASAPSNKSGGDGSSKMPEMGHVARRLAMFQKN